jgi:hypothetical protein
MPVIYSPFTCTSFLNGPMNVAAPAPLTIISYNSRCTNMARAHLFRDLQISSIKQTCGPPASYLNTLRPSTSVNYLFALAGTENTYRMQIWVRRSTTLFSGQYLSNTRATLLSTSLMAHVVLQQSPINQYPAHSIPIPKCCMIALIGYPPPPAWFLCSHPGRVPSRVPILPIAKHIGRGGQLFQRGWKC